MYFLNHPAIIALAANVPPVRNSMMAESPFTDYMARLVVEVFLVGVLVTILLLGGLVLVNLGLMYKRPEDRVGGRTPSDLGLLKNEAWPEVPYEQNILPAQELDKDGDKKRAA